jgi:hypothetical protein
MRRLPVAAVFGAMCLAGAAPASAQRFPFEQTIAVDQPVILDAETVRGKIDVVAGEPGRVVIAGTVTVRVGWDVPLNAEALAKQVASAPPIVRSGNTIRLGIPTDPAALRAVTIAYQVRVPVTTEVHTTSESGATTVRGVSGAVEVRTQSAAIDLASLSGAVNVTTGSGAVMVNDIKGTLTVRTESSGFTGRSLGSSLSVRTQSGQVDADLTGTGDVDVETGSSGIRVRGARGALTIKTQSGQIVVEQGAPSRPWAVTTGSSRVDLAVDAGTGLTIDAESRSGQVLVEGAAVKGEVERHRVAGTIGAGGPLVRVNTGSGAIRIRVR